MILIHRRGNRLILILIALCICSGVASTWNVSAARQTETTNSLRVAGFADDGTPSGDQPLIIEARKAQFQPTPRGEQTLHLAGSPLGVETLDPATARDISTTFLVRQIFRGLVAFDKNLEPTPELADRIEVSADGLSYTFHLRENAKFQDGRQINSDDVVASLKRSLNPVTTGGDSSLLGGSAFLSDIVGAQELLTGNSPTLTGVSAVDSQTVEIHLIQPRATFLMKLASIPASIVDVSEVDRVSSWWRNPNGSGPFGLSSLDDGSATLTPSKYWYEGEPPLKEVTISLGQGALQPFNLYQSGQIEVSPVDLSGIDRALAPEGGLRDDIVVAPQFALEYIAFNLADEPMNDLHIRKALELGFPTNKIADVTFDGYVTEPCGLIPKGMLGQDWLCDKPGFDLDAAKAEINKSRYRSAAKVPPIEIYTAGSTSTEAFRDSIEQSLGLKIDVIDVDWESFLRGLSSDEYPAYSIYWSADYPDPESLLWTLFGSESQDNYVKYHNVQFDDLLMRAASEPSESRRIELYSAAQQILLNDGTVFPLYFDVSYTLVRPLVKGLEVTPIGILGLEHIWMEH